MHLPQGEPVGDDAIHIENPTARGMTLCGQPRYRVMNVAAFTDPMPDSGSGCWTCIAVAKRIDRGMSAWMGR